MAGRKRGESGAVTAIVSWARGTGTSVLPVGRGRRGLYCQPSSATRTFIQPSSSASHERQKSVDVEGGTSGRQL